MQPETVIPNRAQTRQTVAAAQIPEALLKIRTVGQLTGFSDSTIRRKTAAGEFPKPIKYGTRCTRWVAGQVTNWLRASQGAAQ
jgi:prophage regulatory protein